MCSLPSSRKSSKRAGIWIRSGQDRRAAAQRPARAGGQRLTYWRSRRCSPTPFGRASTSAEREVSITFAPALTARSEAMQGVYRDAILNKVSALPRTALPSHPGHSARRFPCWRPWTGPVGVLNSTRGGSANMPRLSAAAFDQTQERLFARTRRQFSPCTATRSKPCRL